MNDQASGAQGDSGPMSTDLFRRVVEVVGAVAARYGEDDDRVSDLTQESLCRVVAKWRLYRAEKGSVESWVATVAHNACKSWLRKNRDTFRIGDEEWNAIPDPAPLPDRRTDVVRRDRRLHAAVAELPPRERTAIQRVYFDGMTRREAAARMGVGVQAVDASLARAVHALKRMPELAKFRAGFRGADRSERDIGRNARVALAWVPRGAARARIRAGAGFAGLDVLLEGVRFASSWEALVRLARRLPGCPVILDPEWDGVAGVASGVGALKRLIADAPDCPVVGYGDGNSRRSNGARAGLRFVSVLRRGKNDDPAGVRLALLQAVDGRERLRRQDEMERRVPSRSRRLLRVVLDESLARSVVGEVAERMKVSPRTLSRACRRFGAAPPKTLLSMGAVYHVERLADWSGTNRGPTAAALGFGDYAGYSHAVQRTLAVTPAALSSRGGWRYVVEALVEAFGGAGGDPSPSADERRRGPALDRPRPSES